MLVALLVVAGCSEPEPSAPPSPVSSVSPVSSGKYWTPAPGTTWQWQLSGTVDRSVDVAVYDIDGFTNGADVVASLHAAGRKVICYVNVGAAEDFRSDYRKFPAAVLGKGLDGWPGERWLDVRRWESLEPIMSARFDMCRTKGFDAIEPDNVDGFANDSGFPLTSADQLTYNRRIAALAHSRGLSIGLKNDLEQVPDLVNDFQFAVNEECLAYDECSELKPFVDAGKAVFHVEYSDEPCRKTTPPGFSSLRKNLELDAFVRPCTPRR
ncbi:endo alpha-1,4 polygalactosaminidase [Cryptosporangium phraense]|uniref:Endo alpha-1,4 polygalactosaminidase n=1 Tax=Cryptosporangium phraense TaxID=2593070 RepID=A0A545AWD4_9ACTN|nr:endo alpha-1,4 polygalactosaminidase [Cryptosporangium phraense]TQS45634.1 endo alpha-1,4 polygalactosaminidase [Cryptosporangium phraense]